MIIILAVLALIVVKALAESPWGMFTALGTAVLLSIPSLAVSLPLKTWRGWLVLPLIVLALGGTGWLLRSWVPHAQPTSRGITKKATTCLSAHWSVSPKPSWPLP